MTSSIEKPLLWIVLVVFGALTLVGTVVDGLPGGAIDAITFNWISLQIYVDLIIAVAMICVWIHRDATKPRSQPLAMVDRRRDRRHVLPTRLPPHPQRFRTPIGARTMPLTDSEAAQLFRKEPNGFLDVGAGEVAHRKIGSGPDVLFVHGWPVSGATWRKLLPHLVDHVTCHVIDLPRPDPAASTPTRLCPSNNTSPASNARLICSASTRSPSLGTTAAG